MTNQQILKRLRLEFGAYILLVALLVVLYETNVFTKGVLVGDVRTVYTLECIGILLTIALIPLALYSFHRALIRMMSITDDAARRKSYVRWNEIRLSMFLVVVLLNTSIYYMTADKMCGYCALMGIIASSFCWTTRTGVATELAMKVEASEHITTGETSEK